GQNGDRDLREVRARLPLPNARSQALPGNADPCRLCLPNNPPPDLRIREAEPRRRCVPRQSLGTRMRDDEPPAAPRLCAQKKTGAISLPFDFDSSYFSYYSFFSSVFGPPFLSSSF